MLWGEREREREEKRHTIWMNLNGWHGMHVWFRDVLNNDGYAIFPHPNRLIIRRGNKSATIVDKGDCVYWAKMLVVLLRNFSRPNVPLQHLLVQTKRRGENDW